MFMIFISLPRSSKQQERLLNDQRLAYLHKTVVMVTFLSCICSVVRKMNQTCFCKCNIPSKQKKDVLFYQIFGKFCRFIKYYLHARVKPEKVIWHKKEFCSFEASWVFFIDFNYTISSKSLLL